MEKKYILMEYNNAVACEVCGGLTFADDCGNTDKCPRCGWIGGAQNEEMDKRLGISYPMLVPLSRAREQYKAGQKFKATFEDFINGLKFYAEMLFWYDGYVCEVFTKFTGNNINDYKAEDCRVIFASQYFSFEFDNINEFRNKANINGHLLRDIWDDVVHPCYMYCGDPDTDYDVPPED